MWSLTIYVFQDSDFAAAMVTNVNTEAAQEHNPMSPVTTAVAADNSCHGDCTKAQCTLRHLRPQLM